MADNLLWNYLPATLKYMHACMQYIYIYIYMHGYPDCRQAEEAVVIWEVYLVLEANYISNLSPNHTLYTDNLRTSVRETLLISSWLPKNDAILWWLSHRCSLFCKIMHAGVPLSIFRYSDFRWYARILWLWDDMEAFSVKTNITTWCDVCGNCQSQTSLPGS